MGGVISENAPSFWPQKKISVGVIPDSTEVCICKVDITYHLFFALAVLIFSATWMAKYKSILSKYKNALSKYKSIVSKYKSMLSKYKSILSNYKSLLSKYKFYFQSTNFTFKVKKHTFKVQKHTFKVSTKQLSEPWQRNLQTRNFLNTSDSRNPVPRAGSVQTLGTEPNPSELIEHRNLRNLGHATFWTQNLGNASGPERGFPKTEPGTLEQQNLSEPSKRVVGSRNCRTAKPVTRNRFPEPSSFPEPPQLAQNTPKSILCKDPLAFCCWGKTEVASQILVFTWATKKTLLTFHYTGWLIGIIKIIMDYYIPYITGWYNHLYNLTNQGFFHCSHVFCLRFCHDGVCRESMAQETPKKITPTPSMHFLSQVFEVRVDNFWTGRRWSWILGIFFRRGGGLSLQYFVLGWLRMCFFSNEFLQASMGHHLQLEQNSWENYSEV